MPLPAGKLGQQPTLSWQCPESCLVWAVSYPVNQVGLLIVLGKWLFI